MPGFHSREAVSSRHYRSAGDHARKPASAPSQARCAGGVIRCGLDPTRLPRYPPAGQIGPCAGRHLAIAPRTVDSTEAWNRCFSLHTGFSPSWRSRSRCCWGCRHGNIAGTCVATCGGWAVTSRPVMRPCLRRARGSTSSWRTTFGDCCVKTTTIMRSRSSSRLQETRPSRSFAA